MGHYSTDKLNNERGSIKFQRLSIGKSNHRLLNQAQVRVRTTDANWKMCSIPRSMPSLDTVLALYTLRLGGH